MNMKKYYSLLVCVLLGALTLTACSDDDDEESSNAEIVGTWFSKGERDEDLESSYDEYLQFRSDGTYTQVGIDYYWGSWLNWGFDPEEIMVYHGTYSYDGTDLVLSTELGGTITYQAKVNGNKMTVSILGLSDVYNRVSNSEIGKYL